MSRFSKETPIHCTLLKIIIGRAYSVENKEQYKKLKEVTERETYNKGIEIRATRSESKKKQREKHEYSKNDQHNMRTEKLNNVNHGLKDSEQRIALLKKIELNMLRKLKRAQNTHHHVSEQIDCAKNKPIAEFHKLHYHVSLILLNKVKCPFGTRLHQTKEMYKI